MRIIGGKYKGRHIAVSKSFRSRPTTDFAKENLFNVLSNTVNFETLDVLDLFAGTGSISFEFVSRGAKSVNAIEINKGLVKNIEMHARELNMQQLKAWHNNAFRYLKKAQGSYHLIFADPPFDNKEIKNLPRLVFDSGILHQGGYFILEHGQNNNFVGSERFTEARKYGSVHFSFFRQ